MRVSIIPSAFRNPVLPFFIMVIFSVSILVLLTVFLLLMFQAGIREHAPRCVILSAFFLVIILVLIVAMVHYRDHSVVQHGSPALVCLSAAALLLSLLKWGNGIPAINMDQAIRYDERDHMFARANLKYHPNLAETYHRAHPERQDVDNAIHAMPELLSPGGRYYDRSVSPVADVAFTMLDRSYQTMSDIDVRESNSLNERDILEGLTLLAERYGAEIGIARTRPWHWYSHNGRQAHNWGKPVETRHATAIVIVIPMDLDMIRHAPSLPVILESSRGYVLAATIAHQVAEYLATHGHDAMAHVDGNYQVICAPLAQEAGMGHVGRMGIFMHHVYGPCCRISVVTTDAQIPVTTGNRAYMEQFCEVCRKCADNCPSRSITDGARPASRGFAHWSIDQESCYTFWRRIGTDCAVCIRSCPFTKPDSLIHRIARWYIRRNPVNRWIALKLDDLFYGRYLTIPSRNPDMEKLSCT